MPGRKLRLRRAGECAVCLSVVDVGVEAMWDSGRKTVTCLTCASDTATLVQSGVAGGSALAKGDQLRHDQLERRRLLKERRPVLGRVQIFMAGPPTEGESWSKGGVGEKKLGAAFDAMVDKGILTLHDRQIPGSQANIDHMVVAPTGIWIIDAKRYKGLVAKVDKGGIFRTDLRLTVGGRDRTSLADGVARQVDHVMRALLGTPHEQVPLHGALCFVDAEFRLFAKPFEIRGVLVTWGKALGERLVDQDGPVEATQRGALHRHLSQAFRPAT